MLATDTTDTKNPGMEPARHSGLPSTHRMTKPISNPLSLTSFVCDALFLRMSPRKLMAATILAMATLMPGANAVAEEPAEKFLGKLRDAGMFEMAEAYLQRMKTSSLASETFKESIDYERAVTVASIALQQSDPNLRDKRMQQAKSLFRSFVDGQSGNAKAGEARNWLRNIALQTARQLTADSKAADSGADSPDLERARSEFETTSKLTGEEIERLKKEITDFSKLPKDKQSSAARKRMRLNYVREKIILATVAFEAADTYGKEDGKLKEQLEEALKLFAEISDKYGSAYPLDAMTAVLYQGKCRQRLGKFPEAMGLFEELIDPQQKSEPVVLLSAEAARGKMECIAENGNLADALAVGETWLDLAPNPASTAQQILELKLVTGELAVQVAKSKGPNSRGAATAAKKHLSAVAKAAGPNRAAARKLLAMLPGGEAGASSVADSKSLSSFTDARQAASEIRDRLQSAETLTKLLQPKLKTAEGPRRAELEKEIQGARREADSLRKSAVQVHRRAIELAPTDASKDDLNQLIFYNCYFSYNDTRYFESAVLGEHLATKHSDHRLAKNAANIALGSYLKLYGDGSSSGAASIQKRLVRLADFIAATWPNDKGAQDALITLVSFMVNQGDVDAAERYLAKIPTDSPRRGDAELRTGGAMWQAYAKGIRENEGKATAELTAMKERAQSTLATGIERMKAAGKSPTLAQASLSLAQIYVDTEQPDKAMSLLNDPEIGPLTLVKKQDPTVASPAFPPLIYKTALRAKLGEMAASPGDKSGMAEAVQLMDGLKSAMGDTPDGKRRLVSTYVGLANDLQKQLALLQPASKRSLANGFDAFLSQVRKDSMEFNVKNWVAETYYKLGESFLGTEGQVTAQSNRYFKNAGEVFGEITKQADGGELEIAPNLAIQIRMRRASIMRQLGDFTQAVDEFENILRKKNSTLNVQIEAAKALQAGGMAGKADLFGLAAKGDRMNPVTKKNTIWGWERIARVVQGQMQRGPEQRKQYEGYFFEAQYNLVLCRLEQGLSSQGDKRTKYLKSAARILRFTSATYPELGGAEWKSKFGSLKSRIDGAS